jgi:Zn-dependent protease with chaperone function
VKTLARRARGAAAWLLAGLVVAAHATLAALAVTVFAALGWPLPTGYDSANVTLVLATAVTGLAASSMVAARAATSSRALRALVGAARRPVPLIVHNAATGLGVAGKVDAVAAGEAFAVTHGLVRPRILVSTGLTAELGAAEITAVLAHEREHLRHRDPLRLLAAQLLAQWAWYLPAGRWLARRCALRRELAADRAAAGAAGRGVLAAALLKLASLPACPAVAAASPAEDQPGSLEARVAQLEDGRPPRQRLTALRVLASGGALIWLAAAAVCCAAMAQVLPGGVL